jgi:hypothetical protein
MAATNSEVRLFLDPWFIHQDLVLALLGDESQSLRSEIARWQQIDARPVATAYAASSALERHLASSSVRELVPAMLDDSLQEGQLVGHQQAYYFRRSKVVRSRIEFHAKLSTDSTIQIVGHFNSDRCVGTSGSENLSGHPRVYMLGFPIEISAEKIAVRPLLFGQRFFGSEEESRSIAPQRSRRVSAEQIDEFSAVRGQRVGTRSDLSVLRDIPEERVKDWFAEILGEPVVPKDWGGERSDLYTSRIHFEGEPVAAAFLLKGPSFFKPMTIAALGKPGDQIKRLYEEPAELMVLQHCHEVRAAVVSMMETYAWDSRRPHRYAVIDGYETLRILRAYGKVK